MEFRATRLALRSKQGASIIAGVVYEVSRNECFSNKNGGAFMNGEPYFGIATCLFITKPWLPVFLFTISAAWDSYMHALWVLCAIHMECAALRRSSRRFVLSRLRKGWCFFEYNLNPWDVAAGALIIQEAGGTVATFQAAQLVFEKEIACTNGLINKEFEIVTGF